MEKRIIKRIGDNNDDVSLHVLLLAVDHDQISVVLLTPVSGRTPPRLVLVVVVLNICLISIIAMVYQDHHGNNDHHDHHNHDDLDDCGEDLKAGSALVPSSSYNRINLVSYHWYHDHDDDRDDCHENLIAGSTKLLPVVATNRWSGKWSL